MTQTARTPDTTAFVLVGAAGMTLLSLRPVLPRVPVDTRLSLTLLFGALAVAAVALQPGRLVERLDRRAWYALGFGVLIFGAGRLVGASTPGLRLGRAALLLSVLAAVSEELFFRRFLYAALERWGGRVALVGSALAFAVVHVPVWGLWALPLDLAAGLLLSWQRAASGSWTVPALTHVAANLLAVL